MSAIAVGLAGAAVAAAACRLSARAARPAVVPAGRCAVVTAGCWAWLGWRWSAGGLPGWWLPVPLAVFAVAAPLALADLRYRRLPDVLTAALAVLVGVAVVVSAVAVGSEAVSTGTAGTGLVVRGVAGAVAFAGVHALVRAVSPRSLGAGDVKLAVGLGGGAAAVGWPALVVSAGVASLVTLVGAGIVRWATRGPPGRGVPHGPGMLLGACLVVAFPGAGLDVVAGQAARAVAVPGMGGVTPGPG
ncbi:leader peptidase (prepilin peptidase)/N-methyltransferase [Prauserella isguenensis]|uniref:Leader peptidase (Prepilin peptidase)/N-methyltransferase n=1 Tax=Prauserella isguenensis TaxID=1470180 RepID=A0A839S9C3_9PSEU|nr:prepilin peptidase [Prauserella isguenensis]MBB3053227.1 leader peptidase (prepilin peptidase)/N-methyltransferase [Prauserella isguenensis]